MLKKIIVEWTYTDDYGRYGTTGKRKLFDTMKEATEWIEMMKEGNGGYFHLFRIFEINYNKYLEIEEIKKKVKELSKKIDKMNEELEVK